MTSLVELTVRGTFLNQLPAQIGERINLKRLELGVNKLTEIPEEIGNLHRLRFLGLHDNPLKAVPSNVLELPHLRHLGLTGTSLRPEDFEGDYNWKEFARKMS